MIIFVQARGNVWLSGIMMMFFFILCSCASETGGEKDGMKGKDNRDNTIAVVKVSQEIKIDGKLDETAWQKAEAIPLAWEKS